LQIFGVRKLESLGYSMALFPCSPTFSYSEIILAYDRQTDGHTKTVLA